jgi:hypothetical protein
LPSLVKILVNAVQTSFVKNPKSLAKYYLYWRKSIRPHYPGNKWGGKMWIMPIFSFIYLSLLTLPIIFQAKMCNSWQCVKFSGKKEMITCYHDTMITLS